jgi:hypothetical protein
MTTHYHIQDSNSGTGEVYTETLAKDPDTAFEDYLEVLADYGDELDEVQELLYEARWENDPTTVLERRVQYDDTDIGDVGELVVRMWGCDRAGCREV